jgi:hypothetical protein
MKKSKPVVFKPKSREFQHEVCFVAQENGLIQDSEYEPFYWTDSVSKRRFRLLELSGELQVSDDNFDRWANSLLGAIRMPLTDEKFIEGIAYLRSMPGDTGPRYDDIFR